MRLGNGDYYQSFVDIASRWFCGYFVLVSIFFYLWFGVVFGSPEPGKRQCHIRIVLAILEALFMSFFFKALVELY